MLGLLVLMMVSLAAAGRVRVRAEIGMKRTVPDCEVVESMWCFCPSSWEEPWPEREECWGEDSLDVRLKGPYRWLTSCRANPYCYYRMKVIKKEALEVFDTRITGWWVVEGDQEEKMFDLEQCSEPKARIVPPLQEKVYVKGVGIVDRTYVNSEGNIDPFRIGCFAVKPRLLLLEVPEFDSIDKITGKIGRDCWRTSVATAEETEGGVEFYVAFDDLYLSVM